MRQVAKSGAMGKALRAQLEEAKSAAVVTKAQSVYADHATRNDEAAVAAELEAKAAMNAKQARGMVLFGFFCAGGRGECCF